MTLTADYIQQQLAAAVQRKEQIVADLNGTIGEIRALQSLLMGTEQPAATHPESTIPEPA